MIPPIKAMIPGFGRSEVVLICPSTDHRPDAMLSHLDAALVGFVFDDQLLHPGLLLEVL